MYSARVPFATIPTITTVYFVYAAVECSDGVRDLIQNCNCSVINAQRVLVFKRGSTKAECLTVITRRVRRVFLRCRISRRRRRKVTRQVNRVAIISETITRRCVGSCGVCAIAYYCRRVRRHEIHQ